MPAATATTMKMEAMTAKVIEVVTTTLPAEVEDFAKAKATGDTGTLGSSAAFVEGSDGTHIKSSGEASRKENLVDGTKRKRQAEEVDKRTEDSNEEEKKSDESEEEKK